MSAGVSFCNSSAWGQMLSESKSGKQVGERMPGPWMVECSKVATQYKRPLARIHAWLTVAGQNCKNGSFDLASKHLVDPLGAI